MIWRDIQTALQLLGYLMQLTGLTGLAAFALCGAAAIRRITEL